MEVFEIKALAKAMGLYDNIIAEHHSFNLHLDRRGNCPKVDFCAMSLSQNCTVSTYTRLMSITVFGEQQIVGIQCHRDIEYLHTSCVSKQIILKFMFSLYEEVLKRRRRY